MKKSALKVAGLMVLLVSFAVVCLAWVFPGRMTGGGSVFVGSNNMRVTHGFEIHCGSDKNPGRPGPNNLEVNWPDHQFHMKTVTLGHCECNSALLPPSPPLPGSTNSSARGQEHWMAQTALRSHLSSRIKANPEPTTRSP